MYLFKQQTEKFYFGTWISVRIIRILLRVYPTIEYAESTGNARVIRCVLVDINLFGHITHHDKQDSTPLHLLLLWYRTTRLGCEDKVALARNLARQRIIHRLQQAYALSTAVSIILS